MLCTLSCRFTCLEELAICVNKLVYPISGH
uniref:Uncharacterized protein n=1 Tax=Anguilla anguilla TaxID=7936 RepID=A0A0E9QPA7_ANGAN